MLNIATICIGQIPTDKLALTLPGRDRSYLALANHIFEIANGFTEIANGAAFKGRIAAAQPEKNRSPEELARYGQGIIRALDLWFSDWPDKDCVADVETFYGTQSLHAVLERCTWHAAQHVRQIMMVLDLLDIPAKALLRPEDLRGLPLPKQVWD